MFVDGAGVPLAMVITGANRHDASQLETLLDSIIIARLDPFECSQNLCLDKGFSGKPTEINFPKTTKPGSIFHNPADN
jgi:hypothetical protein